MANDSTTKLPVSLRAFVEQLPLPCAALDRDLVVVANNRAWTASFQLPEDIVGVPNDEVFPDIPDHWREVLARALEGEAATKERDEFVRADGRQQYLTWTVTPWRDADTSIGGVIITSADVTEEVVNERRGREQEVFIRAFVSRSPIGLNLCRIDGLWIESNQAFLDIIGYSSEEADGGLTYWELTPRVYDDAEAEQLKNLESTGRYGPYEKEFIRKDGSLVPVRLHGFFIEREGERFIWSLIEDLTDRRALESRVEQERLKAIQASKLATIGEMAAGFAHEINNPLTIIEAYAFEIEEARGDAALIAEATAAIREATQRAGTIVRGLRKLARDETGRPSTAEDVDALMLEAVGLCRARGERAEATIDVQADAASTTMIHGVELLQVVINLVNNALDAVASQEKRSVQVRSWREGDEVFISVSDSGPGVRPEDRERIFEPFFTTKDVNSGTGLGLSISRSIVEGAGGELSLDDDQEQTRFVVRLPRAACA